MTIKNIVSTMHSRWLTSLNFLLLSSNPIEALEVPEGFDVDNLTVWGFRKERITYYETSEINPGGPQATSGLVVKGGTTGVPSGVRLELEWPITEAGSTLLSATRIAGPWAPVDDPAEKKGDVWSLSKASDDQARFYTTQPWSLPFQWLGTVSGPSDVMVSGDGSTIPSGHLRWSAGIGWQDLGGLPLSSSVRAYYYSPTGISFDGSLIVGRLEQVVWSGSLSTTGFAWSPEHGMVPAMDLFLPGCSACHPGAPSDLTSDGSAVFWGKISTQSTHLADPPIRISDPSMSGDGSRAVGGNFEIWLGGNEVVTLEPPLPGEFLRITDMSTDGTSAVGWMVSGKIPIEERRAVRWNEASGLEVIHDGADGILSSLPYAVSGDGSIVVGEAKTDRGYEAFVWDRENGMRNLKSVIEEHYGITVHGTIGKATGISDDGSIVGGYYPSLQETEGIPSGSTYWVWRAVLPKG